MEDVIKKTEGQLKNILDDLVDYKNHSSKKDQLIKELTKTKTTPSPQKKTNSTHKPGASLNSSTYSSAASSSSTASDSSSSSSSASDSSTTSSISSNTSSASASTSSSPSQSQNGIVSKPNTSPSTSANDIIKNLYENDEVELAKMVELGKKAKFLEIRLRDPSDTTKNLKTSKNVNISENVDFLESSKNGAELKLATIYKSNEAEALLDSVNNDSSWKTKRDKRRKKPVEKEIKAGEIPGNIGYRTVEELEDFIKSGTNGTSNNSNKNKNNKSKTLNNNSNGTSNVNNNYSNNIGATNSTQNANSTNLNKKNDNNAITNNNKPNHMSSKMNNHVQSKNPPQQFIHNQPQSMVTQNFQQQNKQPIQSDNGRENNHQKGVTKPTQTQTQTQPQQTQTKQTLTPNQPTRQSQTNQQRRSLPPTNQPQPKQQQQQQKQNQTKPIQASQSTQENQQAVVFANHIQVRDEDIRQYVFGFFEEQTSQTQKDNTTNSESKTINQNSQTTDSRRPPNIQSDQISKNETRQRMKQLKPSPNSEVPCKKKDNIDVNSFNFDQILKFISESWKQTQTKRASNMHNH